MAVTEDDWKFHESFGSTESKPFQARRLRDALLGLAKPGVKRGDDVPRAAHEKIASDLAFRLDLPVPPVVLWDRGSDEVAERYVSISAWAFTPADSWAIVGDRLNDAHKREAAVIASAMLAFDTWISAGDRKPAHVLVNIDDGGGLQIAFIDYAYSLSYSWRVPNAKHKTASKCLPLDPDADSLREAVRKIGELDDGRINEIVERMPKEFLSEQKQETIVSNLVSRKNQIGSLLGIEAEAQ